MAKRLLVAAAVFALVAGGCAEEAAGPEGGEEGGVTIALSLSTLQNPFFVTLRDGAQGAADQAGVELAVADAQDDAQTQASDIDDFITRGVDVIIVNPVDSAAVVPSVEAANDADIPVVTVDRASEGGEIAAHIASDNVQGGEMACEYLIEQIGDSGTVAQLEGIPGTSAAQDRGEGCQQALDAAADVELVATQTAEFDREQGFSVAQNIFQANPDLNGLFAQNDEMALGAVEAAREAGILEDLVIVGFDAVEDALAAIEAGDMEGTIAQLPDEMGRLSVEAAVGIAGGEEVEENQPVEVVLVTPDNVGEFTS
jgi:ribose transport system substrate-binding protein